MITWNNVPEDSFHQCTSVRSGDWIVWKCKFCSDPANPLYSGYERKLNLKTGQMITSGRNDFRHSGFHDGSPSDVINPLTKNLGEN